jgi:hypothetical protein
MCLGAPFWRYLAGREKPSKTGEYTLRETNMVMEDPVLIHTVDIDIESEDILFQVMSIIANHCMV